MAGAEHVGECALALGAPHDAVDVVGAGPVLGDVEEPVVVVGIVEAAG